MKLSGAEFLEAMMPELERFFNDRPAFGSLGFRVHFAEGSPVRIEYEANLSKRVDREERNIEQRG